MRGLHLKRYNFNKLVSELNLIDIYRIIYPKKIEYTYWSYLNNSRKNNKGWRIDYFLINENMIGMIDDCEIIMDKYLSDHAPILLKIK